MKKYVFACYDQKTKLYSQPFYAVRPESAIRDFSYAANDPQTEIYRYADDFSLVQLGTFDDETGRFDSIEGPQTIRYARFLKDNHLNSEPAEA